jgi:hypothetical protein
MTSTLLVRCIQRARAPGGGSARQLVGLCSPSPRVRIPSSRRSDYAFTTVPQLARDIGHHHGPQAFPLRQRQRQGRCRSGQGRSCSINSVEDDKHILSLSSGGKVFEYL